MAGLNAHSIHFGIDIAVLLILSCNRQPSLVPQQTLLDISSQIHEMKGEVHYTGVQLVSRSY
jgi:hypothetical protein